MGLLQKKQGDWVRGGNGKRTWGRTERKKKPTSRMGHASYVLCFVFLCASLFLTSLWLFAFYFLSPGVLFLPASMGDNMQGGGGGGGGSTMRWGAFGRLLFLVAIFKKRKTHLHKKKRNHESERMRFLWFPPPSMILVLFAVFLPHPARPSRRARVKW